MTAVIADPAHLEAQYLDSQASCLVNSVSLALIIYAANFVCFMTHIKAIANTITCDIHNVFLWLLKKIAADALGMWLSGKTLCLAYKRPWIQFPALRKKIKDSYSATN